MVKLIRHETETATFTDAKGNVFTGNYAVYKGSPEDVCGGFSLFINFVKAHRCGDF